MTILEKFKENVNKDINYAKGLQTAFTDEQNKYYLLGLEHALRVLEIQESIFKKTEEINSR